jgi:hypothetical protein
MLRNEASFQEKAPKKLHTKKDPSYRQDDKHLTLFSNKSVRLLIKNLFFISAFSQSKPT